MIGPMGAQAGHHEEMEAALEIETLAQGLALEGRAEEARAEFAAAAERYRASWELASATSYGRLVGMLKAAVLAGGGQREAAYARAQIATAEEDSMTAAYVRALAALLVGEDGEVARWAAVMRRSPGAFARTGAALEALAEGEEEAYRRALEEIVGDFEERSSHLTGVAIADTALMLEELAGRRGMRTGLSSPVLPAGWR